ncbi:MAG TPA: phosphoadenylyl-sulfate reductase [Verrucomicrobiae bacterium]|nr:phosphoadenylyl-sulfate reductase [Verrucomicrobiae bacterium]
MIERSPSIPLPALAVEEAARELEGAAPREILTWAIDAHPRIALACSFGGITGVALLDLVMRIDRTVPVYYLDTGLLFPETYALIDRLARRYDVAPIRVAADLTVAQQRERFGDELWSRDPDACCALRKIEPQRSFLRGYDAWISGIRRDQTADRRRTPVAAWDERFGLVKVNPFAAWSEHDIWSYAAAHRLEYNPLHDAGYASIGCVPCTRATRPGEDPRCGRWPQSAKTECGLHR